MKEEQQQVRWITQGGDLNTNYTSKLENLLPDIGEKKSVKCNLYVDELQGTHRYDTL